VSLYPPAKARGFTDYWDNMYGFFDGIEILRNGTRNATNNGANELSLRTDTIRIVLQFAIFALL